MEKNKEPFDSLVLSGGGIKGIITLGALNYYYEKKELVLENIKEYSGTSVGSLICLLMICGYKPLDIYKESININNLLDIFKIEITEDNDYSNLWNIMTNMGLTNTNSLKSIIEKLVFAKLGKIPTLGELENITNKKFYIVTADVTHMKERILSSQSDPEMNCVDAIIYSCSLPFIFQRKKYNNSYLVDGGIINNFPWNCISKERKKILGIAIVGSAINLSEESFWGYLSKLIAMPIDQITNMNCENAPSNVKIIQLNWNNFSSFVFNVPDEEKMKMFDYGYYTTKIEDKKQLIKIKNI